MTDGATQTPEWQKQQTQNQDACKPAKSERTFKHNWVWVWKDGHMTNKVRCTNCEEVRELGE